MLGIVRHAPREQVMTALFDLLKTAPPPIGTVWRTQGRRLLHWDDVAMADQPAMFMKLAPQDASQAQAMALTQWKWHAVIFVYFQADGANLSQDNVPDILIDNFIETFEKTLDPQPGKRQTLGGLVTNCWIDGTIFFDDGLVDNQAVIVIPVTILIGI